MRILGEIFRVAFTVPITYGSFASLKYRSKLRYRTTFLVWIVVSFVFAAFIGLVASNTAEAATITDEKTGVPFSLKIQGTELEVNGCVAPHSLVTITNDSAVVGTVTSDAGGQYAQLLTAQAAGIHVIDTFFEDSDTNISTMTTDLVALPVKTLTRLTVNPSPTVVHSPDPVAAGSLLTFRGYTCPNQEVTVAVDNNTTLTAMSDANGLWVITLNSLNFTQGSHTYTVQSAGPGYVSSVSGNYQFTVSAAAPSPQSDGEDADDEEANLSIPVVITSPDDGHRTGVRDVLVIGTGPPNAQIEVFVDGQLAGSVFSNSFGEWSLLLSVLGAQQSVAARACNSLGCSELSNTVQVLYGLVGRDSLTATNGGDCRLKIYLEEYRFNKLARHKGIDINIRVEGAEPRFDVVTDWGGVAVDHQTMEDRTLRLHHAYHVKGHYNGIVTIQTEDGACKDVVYFSVRVTDEDPSSYTWLLYLLGILALFVAYYTVSTLRYRSLARKHASKYRKNSV